MSRYLVTGATGFLGGHVVRALLGAGDEVVALARGDGPELAAQGVTIRRADVLDRKALEQAMAGAQGVFHCAGVVSRKPEDAELLRRVHVEGTRNVIAAARAAGVRRVVHASTSGTIGMSEDPGYIATEGDDPPHGLIARFPYYRAKLYAEQAALEGNGADLEVVSVNPSLLLGPGDARGSSTEDVRMFLERKVLAVPSGGLAYVDVRDAASAMAAAMTRGAPGERYLVSACNITVRAFFERLERVSGVKAPHMAMPKGFRIAQLGAELLGRAKARFGVDFGLDPVTLELASLFWYVDSTSAERDLAFSPRDPVQTLHDTVQDLRARGVVWPEPSA